MNTIGLGSFFSKKDTSPIDVIITGEVEGNLVTSTVIQRKISSPDIVETLIRDEGLVGTFFKPVGAGPFPGIILVSGSGGGELLSPWARLLASRYGYATFSLAYTNAENLPRHLVNIPLEYFENAIHWMQSKNEVRADRIAIIGHSRGGELALLLGATFPQIKAIVALFSKLSNMGVGMTEKQGKNNLHGPLKVNHCLLFLTMSADPSVMNCGKYLTKVFPCFF